MDPSPGRTLSAAIPRLRRVLAGGGVVMSALAALASCTGATPIPPVAPGLAAGTPVGLSGGVLPTATITPGPSPTSDAVATRVTPPPEPLRMPGGFGAGIYADGVEGVRMLALAPGGDVFASVPRANRVVALPDRDGDGVADGVHVFAEGEGLNQPNGIAFWRGYLYVANTDGVVRIRYTRGDLEAQATPEVLVPLPGEGLHPYHSLAIGLDGEVYVGVGSSCDVCVEPDQRRGRVLRFREDGSEAVLFASGLRAPAGLAVNPESGGVWASDSGRDGLGQDRPPAEVNALGPGSDYGWPNCWGDRTYDGTLGADRRVCDVTIPPALALSAHSAPQGMAFYTGTQFPPAYHGGLFVALHGTWNKYLPTGYSVVFAPFVGAQSSGKVLGFVDGWLMPDTRRWGSPVDVLVAPDGALLVSDDGAGRVYRIFYAGPRPTATPVR